MIETSILSPQNIISPRKFIFWTWRIISGSAAHGERWPRSRRKHIPALGWGLHQ